jgi:hypothetical protein
MAVFRKPIDIRVEPWILQRWILVAYLVIPDIMGRLGEVIKAPPNEEFYSVVSKYMQAYLEGGEMPPEEIAPAIMNLADDFIAGKQMTLRAGDYIAIRTFMRR